MAFIDTVAVGAFLFALFAYALRRKNRLPLPPGPMKLPLVGNLFNMPPVGIESETYQKWCKELNTDILHLDAAGTNIIILNTHEAAVELLERRSSKHSGRPRMPMVNELMGWDFHFAFMDYGDQWRTHRRLMHNAFHPAASNEFRPQQLKSARSFLRRVLDDPDDLLGNIRHLSGEGILSATYGLEINSKNDKYINLAKSAVGPLLPALIPGTYLVDVIPALKYVPEWLPGADFRKTAKTVKIAAMDMMNIPYEAAKREIEKGGLRPSFCRLSLGKVDREKDIDMQEEEIKFVAGALYSAGADSTLSAVALCILALLNHPEAIKKAHAEIDRVVKPGNLPDFDDEPALPYITAIIKESLRWRNTTPLPLPHLSHVDDEYQGYLIPKGSIILANIWAMLHDENVYPDPFSFKPERFLTEDGQLDKTVKDPDHAIWGFGRRICPGRYMAASSIWITVASFIAAFDFSKLESIGGLDHPCKPGVIRVPQPFKCSLHARTKEMENIIRQTENSSAGF